MRFWNGRTAGTLAGAMAMASALLLPAAGTASATARTTASGGYLALGDSVAFGYVPSNASPPPNYNDPSSFVGYPEDLAKALDTTVVNASCPGETTISFLAAGGQSNGCENSVGSPIGYRSAYPLHVKYTGTQMAFAIQYLQKHPKTSLVTIDMGANDAFVCQQTTPDGCTSLPELEAVLSQIQQNLGSIYQQLRDVAGYKGTIVALTYYSTNYAPSAILAETQILDNVIASVTRHWGGLVANGLTAFRGPSAKYGGNPCTAGLLIKVPGGTCNIHPSPEGHLLLAAAIAHVLGD